MLPFVHTVPRPSLPPAGLSPAHLLATWVAETAGGRDDLKPRLLRLSDGHLVPLDVARWSGPVDRADESLLSRATGAVLGSLTTAQAEELATLADAYRAKFGGDHIDDVRSAVAAYRDRIGWPRAA